MLGRGVTQSDWVKEVKRRSSIWVKDFDPSLRHFAWQGGYGGFSVDPTRLDQVCSYIDGQAEHHRKWSLQDEFRKILNEYNVEFDERYVWS